MNHMNAQHLNFNLNFGYNASTPHCGSQPALQLFTLALMGAMLNELIRGGQGQNHCCSPAPRYPNFGQCHNGNSFGQMMRDCFSGFLGCCCQPRRRVKNHEGNPKKWYFKHGKYKTTKTKNGHIQQDGKTKVVYNSHSRSASIYMKVEGHWQLKETRSKWKGKAASPILLDMDGNGKADVKNGEWRKHADQGDIGAKKVRFDLDGDGKKELTEWTGGKDGLLLNLSKEQQAAYKKNGTLEVSGKELYGDQGGKYKDGYEKMRKLSDKNSDGQLSGKELQNHFVWRDKNRNGVVEKNELMSTQKAGISSVSTTHNGDYQSEFQINGQKRKSWDWWPTTWQ